MTHLHMRQFDGITVGMEVQSPAAFRALKKNITYGEVKPRRWSRPLQSAGLFRPSMSPQQWGKPHGSSPNTRPSKP